MLYGFYTRIFRPDTSKISFQIFSQSREIEKIFAKTMKFLTKVSVFIALFLATTSEAKKVNKQGTRSYEEGQVIPGLKLVGRGDRRLSEKDIAQLAEGARRLTPTRRRLGAKKGTDLVSALIK